jgi:5-methylcytosine-specific restriction endonuclease McrA
MLSDEHKKNIAKAGVGRVPSLETREKLSMSKRGPKNASWRGGRTSLRNQIYKSNETKEWRSKTFTRDNFTCQECGVSGGKLEAHHIKEFCQIIIENQIETFEQALVCDELWDVANGITLCQTCHNKTKKQSAKRRERNSDGTWTSHRCDP